MDDASTPKWRVDFPFTTDGEDEVTRREFARYLVLASGAFAAGSVGVAALDVVAPGRTAARRARSSPRSALAVGAAHLFRYPTEFDPAILVRLAERRAARFQSEVHAPGLRRDVESCRRADVLPVPRRRVRCAQRPGRRRAAAASARDASTVEERPDGMVWALGREVG